MPSATAYSDMPVAGILPGVHKATLILDRHYRIYHLSKVDPTAKTQAYDFQVALEIIYSSADIRLNCNLRIYLDIIGVQGPFLDGGGGPGNFATIYCNRRSWETYYAVGAESGSGPVKRYQASRDHLCRFASMGMLARCRECCLLPACIQHTRPGPCLKWTQSRRLLSAVSATGGVGKVSGSIIGALVMAR